MTTNQLIADFIAKGGTITTVPQQPPVMSGAPVRFPGHGGKFKAAKSLKAGGKLS